VNACRDSFTANVTLRDSSYLVASYSDSIPLVAFNPDYRIVAINGYVGDDTVFGGDMFELSHNAINYVIDGPPEILLIAADGADAAKRDLYDYADIHSIHIYDPRLATPPPALLQMYSTILAWGNNAFLDRILLGNRLADYIDSNPNNGVILLQFCFGQTGRLEGRIMSDYSPFLPIVNAFAYRSLGWYDNTHPLMDSVLNITDYYASDVELQNNGTVIAQWNDSLLFVAHNPVENVIAINGYIGEYRQFSGDMIRLVHNAINFSRDFYTGIEDEPLIPQSLVLYQNYPNPFNSSTTIEYALPFAADVYFEIYDILGRRLHYLKYPEQEPGQYSITFSNDSLSSGVYFYRLRAANFHLIKSMVILK